jgi:hypothetical protein
MIPTMILLGLVFGRWWLASLVAAAAGWPLLLVATDVSAFEAGLIGAAALAVINAAVGVLIHQGGLHAYRHVRRRNSQVVPD